MKTRRLVSLVMLFTFIATGSVLAATVDVSQPVQMTNDSHYERGQSVIYDGTDYWLFYGRSVGCTGSYESGTPDTHDYEVYYKKASSVAGLAAATAVKVPGAHNGNVYLGETTAVYWGGYVRVFAAVDVGATAALYQWYTNNGGASWGEGASATGLPDGAAHSDSASCGGKLWLVYKQGGNWQSKFWNGSWSTEKTIITAAGTGKFFCDGSTLYFVRAQGGNQTLHQWTGAAWNQIDSASESGAYDPTIYKVGSNYVCAYAPWDGVKQYIKAKVGASLNTLLSAGADVMITSGKYKTNNWVDMWPTGFTDNGGDTYCFFTSERNPADTAAEIAGNIWCLPVDWDVTNDHFTYIQEAVDGATAGNTVNVRNGLYVESNIVVNKSLTVKGETRNNVVVAPSAEDTITAVPPSAPPDFDASSQQGFIVVSDNVEIRRLTIDGNANNISQGGSLSNQSNFRNGIINFDAVGTTTANNLIVQNVNIHSVHNSGIVLSYYNGPSNGGHQVKNCLITNVEFKRGISSYASKITVTDNTLKKMGMGIYHSPKPALPAGSGITSTISGNTLEDIGGAYGLIYGHAWPAVAIYYRNPNVDQTMLIQNNNMTMVGGETGGCPGSTAMYIYNADNNSFISSNTINTTAATGNWGIYLGGCAGTTVEENTFTMNDSDSGIYLGRGIGGTPVPNIVKRNTFTSTGSTSAAISEGCAIVQGDHGDLFWMEEIPYDTNNVICENIIDGFVCGILLHSQGLYSVNATITGNSITSTSGLAVDASTLPNAINASGNWWGTATPVGVAGEVTGPVDYTPWLADGTNLIVAPAPGFQGDFSTLWVDDNCPQTGGVGRIQEGVNMVSGSTVHVAAGLYNERVNLTLGKDVILAGAGRDVVTWVAPDNQYCINGSMLGYTNPMNYEIYGFTFNCRINPVVGHSTGIMINHASSGPLNLSIHDNRFIEDQASGNSNHWATSMWLCHNRFAARDAGGNAAVCVYDNIDETLGGMAMSNSQAYDIHDNMFDGCSNAIYNGHGCPDTAGQTFGDHHIFHNIFKNASDALHPGGKTPAIDWQYYGGGGGTHLPSTIMENKFQDNDTAVRFVMSSAMVYPAHTIIHNVFEGNGTAMIVQGANATPVNAEYNYWGDASGPLDPIGTIEVPPCEYVSVADMKNADGLGNPVSENVDYCPWMAQADGFVAVQTNPATEISTDSAKLNGTLLGDTGSVCKYRFNYWKQGDMWVTSTSWTGSIHAGDTFSQVVTGLNPGTEYYFWAEAKNALGQNSWDSGLLRFTTLTGPIQVILPSGGECVLGGSTFQVQWLADPSIANVAIEYSIDNGATWNPIATVPNTDPKQYDWTVPVADSQECYVSVSDAADPNFNGISGDGTVPFCITTHAVPNLIGMTKTDAETAITAAGLTVGAVTYSYSSGMPIGQVMTQNPPKDTPVLGGSAVSIVISIGGEATAKPVAKTESANAIETDTATLRGTVTNDGGGACEYRFCYWKQGDMWITNTSWTGYVGAGQTFSLTLTGLTPGTRYWYWAEAKNTVGRSDGWSSGLRGFKTQN